MFNWLNTSLTRKISGLSTILLSFLFVVILYSVYKLQQINLEMREVAEIDIPLTGIMQEIELLQLKQHILVEQIRLKTISSPTTKTSRTEYIAGFGQYNQQLGEEMDKALVILQNGLSKNRIRLNITEHQSAIHSLTELYEARLYFEQTVQALFRSSATIKDTDWEKLEQQDQELDELVNKLMSHLEQLTLEATRYVEKHEFEFMLVNAVLGISALFIGFYLSLYIIQSFRKRVSRIQGQLESLQHSLAHKVPFETPAWQENQSKDELAELEQDLKEVMGSLSQEMHNRYEIEQQLIELATRDKLTGAFNRHKWDEQLQTELTLAARGATLSLLITDVDHFKRVNDNFGHDTGDKVLQALTALLKQRLRESDLLFRLGGEEFAVLLRQIDAPGAIVVAEALRKQIETAVIPDIPPFTISIGICTYIAGDTADSMMKRADKALYQAKNQGRNRVNIA